MIILIIMIIDALVNASLAMAAAIYHPNQTYTQLQVASLPLSTRQTLSWVETTTYAGEKFFENFDFYTGPDPTNGLVNYLDREAAMVDTGLAFITEGKQAGIQPDHWKHTALNEHRNSVRISSKETFAGGLYIFDLLTFPHGCGVWPALWMLSVDGPWPAGGEIDIIENVHSPNKNQYTLHTTAGCTLSPGDYTGETLGSNCEGNVGCAIRSSSDLTYGEAFNRAGGGVVAMIWDGSGIRMWDWTRSAIPGDITALRPDPNSWGRPAAAFGASTCNMYEYFKPQVMILNVDLCGDWGGGSYASAGCPGTCAERMMNPDNLKDSVMIINSIRVYQQRSQAAHQVTAWPMEVEKGESHINSGEGRGWGVSSWWVALVAAVLSLV